MDDNVLLRFLQSLTGGNNSAEQVPSESDGTEAPQNAPQQQIDPASLGKYEQPFNELVASGMAPEEAYETIMAQIENDRGGYQAPTQENPMQAKIAEYQAQQQQQQPSKFGVYGRTN